ncbi:GH25 family lysozyme [Liquorilactobacillus cacaonum]|uniref:Lyzozyme M1 (1,4-beta-N-acetylmuramidase) n=1 Tax=Liquorilactobacillus cacaonum DSM 21116 TaxID=1423729 RepID=A0A0R2CNK7_9LACO|nr:GH25 family lysozyme [Liquorilactobacillus cacaonum]KRM91508.1 Lyzozyme M1 (1,4-beta-N-acetylmuramidase) [Liquorilactobacillus cacaonum DSM 21116]
MKLKNKILLGVISLIAPFFIALNANAARTDMVDVSSNNPMLSQSDLVNMRNNYGVKAVTVKTSEGSTYAWSGAKDAIQNATNAGLYTNGYHFARFGTLAKAQSEANWAVQNAKADGLGVGSVLVVDVEASIFKQNSIAVNDANIAAFNAIVQAAGYRTDIYASASWLGVYLTVPAGSGWIAAYPNTVTTDRYTNYNGWQFSSKVQLSGISGHFDMTQLYTNYYTAGTDKNAVISDSATTNVTKVTKKTTKTGVAVDGVWIVNNSRASTETTLALQKIYNMKWQDGRISKPSALIKILQKHLGVTQDGYMGPKTIKSMQKKLGTPVDGKISSGYSNMVAAMQKKLNAGTKPF